MQVACGYCKLSSRYGCSGWIVTDLLTSSILDVAPISGGIPKT